MQKIFLNLLIGTLCELIGLFILWSLIHVMKDNIIELGYRSQKIRYQKPKTNIPLWDIITHWTLCKKAKINTKIIWLYFAMNMCLVLLALYSIGSTVVFAVFFDIKTMLLLQLQTFMWPLLPWGVVWFFLDIFLVPSEQKRYGLKNNHKK